MSQFYGTLEGQAKTVATRRGSKNDGIVTQAEMLRTLRDALELARDAGACYTAARIRSAISSAKGAVRAAQHRERA